MRFIEGAIIMGICQEYEDENNFLNGFHDADEMGFGAFGIDDPDNDSEDDFANIFTSKQLESLDYENPPKNDAEAVMRLYQEACATPDLKGHKLVEMMEKYHSDDPEMVREAKYLLCMSVTKMCINICYTRYRTFYQKNPMDLVMSGCNGIMQSLETYNPSKGQLTTWSRNYIIHEIQSFINSHNEMTSHYMSHLKTIKAVIDGKNKRGVNWTVEDIAIETGISAVTISECLTRMNIAATKQSLNDDNNNIAETLSANTKTPEQECVENDTMRQIRDAVDIALTSDAEKRVVKLAYGFYDGEPRTDKQISQILRISELDVRKIKSLALNRIGKYMMSSPKYTGDVKRKKKQVNQHPISFIDDFSKFKSTIINEADNMNDFDNEYFL